jgi:predicted Zn-dependent protease
MALSLLVVLPACSPVDLGGAGGEGPGHRQQNLALTPEEELELGRQAYREVLARGNPLPENSREVRRVRTVGMRIARSAELEPLRREINLHFDPHDMEWEFSVLDDPHINAFCLPGGKVVVFTGLLPVADNDDFLATVLSHEIAHALAHHASERIAYQQLTSQAREAGGGRMSRLDAQDQAHIIRVLAGISSQLYGLSASRRQESEADHIGLFLMAFAGYDPERAVEFWLRMREISNERGSPPELLSDHPSDARRISQIEAWAPMAAGAKRAYDEGRIARLAD